MCKKLPTHTHTHTDSLYFRQLNYFADGWYIIKQTHINVYTYMQGCKQNTAAVVTLTICGIIYCISLVLTSHTLQHLPDFTSHTLLLFRLSHPLPACHYKPASSSHTHTTVTCCEELPSATLTISKSDWVREIHFGFFLFFQMFCEAVVMVMGYKDSPGSQCTHEWEEHRGWVFWVCVCVWVCIMPRIMPWRGLGMICQWSAGSDMCFIACWTQRW